MRASTRIAGWSICIIEASGLDQDGDLASRKGGFQRRTASDQAGGNPLYDRHPAVDCLAEGDGAPDHQRLGDLSDHH